MDKPEHHMASIHFIIYSFTFSICLISAEESDFFPSFLQRKVRLRYKLTLTHGGQQLNETGEIDNFPDWTSLIGHWKLHRLGLKQTQTLDLVCTGNWNLDFEGRESKVNPERNETTKRWETCDVVDEVNHKQYQVWNILCFSLQDFSAFYNKVWCSNDEIMMNITLRRWVNSIWHIKMSAVQVRYIPDCTWFRYSVLCCCLNVLFLRLLPPACR